jgi:hypothetical protein
MILDTIQMDIDEAFINQIEYQDIPLDERQPGDEEKLAGYRAMAKGQMLIELIGTMQRGGLDARGMPRLAICRASAKKVFFVPPAPYGGGGYYFVPERYWRRTKTDRVVLPRATWARQTVAEYNAATARWAVVPSIPPEHRPRYGKRAGNLDYYHILWEAEWKPEPPGDPVLLRHVAGTLYAVIAQWDLTALEKAVMRSQMFTAAN